MRQSRRRASLGLAGAGPLPRVLGRRARRGLGPAGRPPRSFQFRPGRHGHGRAAALSGAPSIAEIAWRGTTLGCPVCVSSGER
jgi:hypothetical protein